MITYKSDKLQEVQDVADVFKNSGIRRPYEDLTRIKRMTDNSDILITAWADGKMIGVARAITDYSYCCYLSDLAVNLDFQKHGVGKELIKRVHEECSLVLLSSPSAVEFYPQVGFEKAERAFVIKRQK